VAASYAGFWTRYLKIAAADRHFYEVIPEGSPCKLYFDLEFPRAANPQHGASAPGNAAASLTAAGDTDAAPTSPFRSPSSPSSPSNGGRGKHQAADDAAVELFIKTVLAQLKAQFDGLRHSPDRVLDLESGTDLKFSRHLIFADAVFADNIQAGHFVREVRPFVLRGHRLCCGGAEENAGRRQHWPGAESAAESAHFGTCDVRSVTARTLGANAPRWPTLGAHRMRCRNR